MSAEKSVERVVTVIVDEALKEALEEVKNSFDQGLSQIKRVREDVMQEVGKRIAEARRRAASLKLQRISAAEMKAKWSRISIIDEFVNDVFRRSLSKIRGLRDDAGYKDILLALTLDGLRALNSKSAILVGRHDDKRVLEEVAKELSEKGYSVTVLEESIETTGGVKVMIQDGSIIYDNTFESRLQRFGPELRRRLYALIEQNT